ncbi:hypothetical protein [Anatilimnocola floriformis]|uniref:hypothetical protein n=1 Tax=Anatilimnocola floriformis TaxID=2948575 RepID=UPI0020C3B657|nr:hypothetical protein [Anatilimnocola floriformis]
MKSLLGKTYAQLTSQLRVKPEKHLHSVQDTGSYSIFVDGNEFLFSDDRLFSVEVSDFSAVNRIPGFEFPIGDGLEQTLENLTDKNMHWEVYPKYSREHWVVIKLMEHGVLYEFEFIGGRFELRFLRLEAQ